MQNSVRNLHALHCNFVEILFEMTTIEVPHQVKLGVNELESLQNVDGIANVKVVNENKLELVFERVDLKVISHFFKLLNEFQTESKLVSQTFEINNLSCDGCATSATRILNNQHGVLFVQVNFSTKSAFVVYDAALISAVQLKAAVKQLGFDLVIG